MSVQWCYWIGGPLEWIWMDWIWMDRIDVLCGLDRFLLEAPGAPVAILKLESIGLSINVASKFNIWKIIMTCQAVFFDPQFKIPSFDAPYPLLSSTADIISTPVLTPTPWLLSHNSSVSELAQLSLTDHYHKFHNLITLSLLLSLFTLISRFSNQMSLP